MIGYPAEKSVFLSGFVQGQGQKSEQKHETKKLVEFHNQPTSINYGDRVFTAAAPSLWNKLPSEIREEDNFERFKSKLKTFLFRAAYRMKSS